MELLIIVLPIINAMILGLFGRLFGIKLTKILIFISFCVLIFISFFLFIRIGINNNNTYIVLFTWFNNGLIDLELGFLFDSLTITILLIVIVISGLVHIYSFEYMSNDPHIIRFISFLSLFTCFMIILITASNLIQLFVGWEGVGLCSYLLINFWFERIQANKAALKAIILNRIGDIFVLISIAICLFLFKTTSFNVMFVLLPFVSHLFITIFSYKVSCITVLTFCLLMGIIAKSAQFGLHVWLPDAMEGPTPVSALLHAATMVIAGIFLMIRCSIFFEMSDGINFLGMLIGSITVLLAGTISMFQSDIKKIIAYSTCSQIGYMLFICSLSQYVVSLFHLFNHAFFKALLFLCAGVIIHAFGDEQDIRKMFNLNNLMPVVSLFMLIGNITLGGLFFLTGFYSKDIILELSVLSIKISSAFVYWLGSFLAFWLTNQYSYLLGQLFSSKHFSILLNNKLLFNRSSFKNIHSISLSFFLVLSSLCLCSIFIGYFGHELFLNGEIYFFFNSIVSVSDMSSYNIEFLPFKIKIIPLLVCCVLVIVVDTDKVAKLFFKKWFFDSLNNYFSYQVLRSSYNEIVKNLDKGVLEYVGPRGFSKIAFDVSKLVKLNQTGLISNYLFILSCGLLVILWLLK